MSYIIASVNYSESAKEYSVECFRTDVKAGEQVIVRISDGRFARATVVAVRYLNWDCKSRVICKASEGALAAGRLQLGPETPQKIGLVSLECLISLLRDRGWTPLRYTNTYRMVLAKNNETQTARIWVRKNGVDLQLLPDMQPMPRAFSSLSNALADGRLVRHYLSHTTFNLFEGIVRFAEAFESNEENYERFFSSVGRGDRRTEALKEVSARAREQESDQEFDVEDYIESNGGGERAYLGDGMWVTSGGRFEDSGR